MALLQVESQTTEQEDTKAASPSDLMWIMTRDGAVPSTATLHRAAVTSGV